MRHLKMIAVVFLGCLQVAVGCAASTHDSAKQAYQPSSVLGVWKLAGLKWDGQETQANDTAIFSMTINTDSVVFRKQCDNEPLSATTTAQISDGAIHLDHDTDTSCEQNGDEVWKSGKRLYEIDDNTMKFYPEEDKGKGYWLWRR